MLASAGNALNHPQRHVPVSDDHRARRHLIHSCRTTIRRSCHGREFQLGDALPVKVTHLAALNEPCTVPLADTGRRTVLVALSPGQVGLHATITPPTQTFMPSWNGEVIVTPNGT